MLKRHRDRTEQSGTALQAMCPHHSLLKRLLILAVPTCVQVTGAPSSHFRAPRSFPQGSDPQPHLGVTPASCSPHRSWGGFGPWFPVWHRKSWLGCCSSPQAPLSCHPEALLPSVPPSRLSRPRPTARSRLHTRGGCPTARRRLSQRVVFAALPAWSARMS